MGRVLKRKADGSFVQNIVLTWSLSVGSLVILCRIPKLIHMCVISRERSLLFPMRMRIILTRKCAGHWIIEGWP